MKIVLASQSPRRRELLSLIVKDFTVIVGGATEETLFRAPEEMVCQLAERKARAVKACGEAVIIGADTIVYLDGEVLGKPSSREDAQRMIRKMAGRTHKVYTGIALLEVPSGRMLTDYECTEVEFACMNEAEIEEYLGAEEYADKAGGYGIQGAAAKYVKRIRGCFYNVMGFPVHKVYQLLKNFEH